MKDKYRYLSKNMLLFTISNLGTKLITFMLIPLYTNFLSTEEYGVIDIVGTFVNILLPVLTLSLDAVVLRFCMDDAYEKEEVFSSALYIWLRSLLFSFLLACILHFFGAFSSYKYFWLYFFLLYVCTGMKDILLNFCRGVDQVNVMAEVSIVSVLTLCLFNILFLTFLDFGIMGYFVAYLCGSLVTVLWGSCRLRLWRYYVRKRKNKRLLKEIYAYGGPLIFNQIGWWLNNSVDKYVVLFSLGMADNGVYSVAYKIPTIIGMLGGIFSGAWSLSVIKGYKEEDMGEFASQMYRIYNSILVMGCSVLLLINIPLARFLFAKEFFSAWKLTGILVIAAIFNSLSTFFGAFFSAEKDSKSYAQSTIIGGIVNIIVSIVLVNIFGTFGVAIGTLVAYICIWAIRYHKCQSYVSIKIALVRDSAMYFLLLIECMIGLKGFALPIIVMQTGIFVVLFLMNYKEVKWGVNLVRKMFNGKRGKINGEIGM